MKNKLIGKSNPAYKHGLVRTPEHNIWSMMRQRCRNPKNKDYKDYGGRGIKICKRWDSFNNFISDMGPRPTTKHSIDRINNFGDYKPSNCQWSTNKFQCNHTRKNIFLSYNGEKKTIAQWSEHLKIGYSTLHNRYRRSRWSDVKILTTPV